MSGVIHVCMYSWGMTKRLTHVSDNRMVIKVRRKKAILHSHHKSGGLRKEIAKHTLRCLLGAI